MLRCSLHRFSGCRRFAQSSSFSTAQTLFVGQDWRAERGLSRNPNAHGPLTDLPDISYADGRPAPLAFAQQMRILRHREYAGTIMKLSKEVDFAVERYHKLKEAEKEGRATILRNKLKPKGEKLLEKLTSNRRNVF